MNIILFFENELDKPLLHNDPRYIHIHRILKLAAGDTIKAGIINGNRGTATITQFQDRQIHLSFDLNLSPIPFQPVRIICGLPRPQQAKRILRDCTSAGVSHIWFFHTELGEKSYQHSPLWRNNAWMHCVREGVEQSGGTLFPDVHVFSGLTECLADLPDSGNRIMLDHEPSGLSAKDAFPLLETQSSETTVFIGSERGWTPGEKNILLGKQCRPVSLGNRLLRTDTACIAAAVLCASLRPLREDEERTLLSALYPQASTS